MSEIHAETVAFARDTMLPPAPPPSSQIGAVRWLRENLFSSWLNVLLTVLSVWVVWWALKDTLPWALRGIWNAGSLTECRQIRDQLYGEGVEAACWAVIGERWNQFMFGIYYPPSGYWRPFAALLMFLVGLVPVLFPTVPRRALILTPLAPFLCYWLLLGGSLWGPLLTVAGLALGLLAFRAAAPRLGALAGLAAGVVAAAAVWAVLVGPLTDALAGAVPLALAPVKVDQLGGFTLSTFIGLSAIVLSLPLGIVLALARRSDMPLISWAAVTYIEVIRGVPLIVWLFVAHLLLNYFLPRNAPWKPDLAVRVIIMVTLFSAAYIAEVIRGGLAALPKGQIEAGDAMGLTYWQAMGLIILPQALRISIPGIVSSFIGLFKDTTLVVTIGLLDPMGIAKQVRASTDWNGVYWEIYIFIALAFFVFCFSMGRYSMWLERRLARDHRR